MVEPTASFPPSDPSTPTQVFPAAPPGDGADRLPVVPGYELLDVLGRGGMSVVYKARQLQPSRVVALKMILRGPHASSEERVRFLQEAEAVAALRHPNIVEVYAVGQLDGVPYFTLEYVPGGSLGDRTRDGPLPPRAAAEVLEPVARAVAAAHAAGFVHRDLKPDNVLLTADGAPKVADFGLAKRLALESGLTRSGAVFGTPSYMAPEQAAGRKDVGPPADVWGLGATLYRMLTGRPPFLGATAMETCHQVSHDDPVPPGRLVANLPRDLETVCLKCLQKDPARRYAGATELADDLRRFLNGESIRARPVGPAERAVKWVKRNPAVTALLAAVFLALAAGTAVSTFFAVRAADREQAASLAALGESRKADEARRAEEETKDVLCRSLFEQARSLRQSRSPGRSSRALGLLQKAALLRNRERPDGAAPPDDLPTMFDLRSEVVAALGMTDAQMIAERPVHGGQFLLSGDGRVAVSTADPAGSGGAQAVVTDIETGAELGRVARPDVELRFWQLDYTGRRVAIALTNGSREARRGVRVVELPSGKELAVLDWPKDPDRGLVVPAWATDTALDGDLLASAKLDEECVWLLLWDLTRPQKPLRTFRFPHSDPNIRQLPQPLLIGPGGKQIAVGLADHRVALVNADGTGEPTFVTPPNPERVALRGWFPDHPWWLLADRQPDDGPVTPVVWDFSAAREVYRLPACEANAPIDLVGNGEQVVVGTGAGTLRRYDAATGRGLGETPALHPRAVLWCRTLPDGRVATAATDTAAVRLWEPFRTPVAEDAVAVPKGTDHVAFCPDRDLVVATKSTDRDEGLTALRTYSVVETRSGRVLRTWQEEAGYQPPVPLPGGRLLATGGFKLFDIDWATGTHRGERLTIRDLATGRVAATRTSGEFGLTLFGSWDELAESGGRVLMPAHFPSAAEPKAVVVTDLVSGQTVHRLTHPDLLRKEQALAITPDGRYLLASDFDKALAAWRCAIWDVAQGRPVGAIPSRVSLSFDLSRDGRWATAWANDGTGPEGEFRVYALPSGEVRWRFPASGLGSQRALGRDGRYFAIGETAGAVRVYDLTTGTEAFRWELPEAGPVRQVMFTPSGGLAVLPQNGGVVRVLDVAAVRKQLDALGLGW